MSAVGTIGGAAASQTHHVKPHNATESLQKIQTQAVEKHQAESVSVSKSTLNIHA